MQEALKNFSDRPEIAKRTDFTPFEVLYRAYLAYRNQLTYCFEEVLNRVKFGTALRRVFPYLEEDRWKRCQRIVAGRRVTGFIGLKGPGSTHVQATAGNKKGRPPAATVQRTKDKQPIDDDPPYMA